MNPSLAQTNLQLYRQLEELGWQESLVSQVEQGCRLAQRLWSGRYRPSDKPFVDHLVGTASALAGTGQPPQVVLAGLLHAAYESGDFGPGRSGVNGSKRQVIRACVGVEAEELVLDYFRFAWWPDGVAELSAAPTLSPNQRTLVAMRIANEWDDWLDGGVLRSGKRHLAEHQTTATSKMVLLARSHGLDDLAAGLQHAIENSLRAEISGRTYKGAPTASFLVLPASAQPREAPRETMVRIVRTVPGARPLARSVRRLYRE